MKKILMIIASTMILSPINAESFNNIMRSQSSSIDCMASEKCIDGIKQIKSISDISNSFPNIDYSMISAEVDKMLDILKRIKVKVFLADQKYFPVRYRGIYSTKKNNFFLNKKYANNPRSILFTMRHEGWHVAQDCKAGMDNMRLDIILAEKYIPQTYRDYVEEVYTGEPNQIPFEKGAFWASVTKDVTLMALDACDRGYDFYFHTN
tara:strand:- start:42 stop:662 length:621 start_codon:yes stop_codon:yes gene_type:complete